MTPGVPPGHQPGKTIKVLVVDDSALIRRLLTRELERDGSIEVVASAPDPYVARDRILERRPDVLTLDLEMPRMDGLTFLRRLMRYHPMPVIVLSSLSGPGTHLALEALAAGAVDVLCKPCSSSGVGDLSARLIEKVRVAARSKVRPVHIGGSSTRPQRVPALGVTTHKVFALGASTGGVQALTQILSALPPDAPGTVVVQHMPPRFTASFAQRLDSLCAVRVKEAQDGDRVAPGRVLIAPGGKHMVLRRSGAEYLVGVESGPEVHRQRPSVEVLFDSVAQGAGANAVGAILTDMGADGALGLLNMFRAGGRTVAQDEATSVVFGMPMEAIKLGAAQHVVPLPQIASTMLILAG